MDLEEIQALLVLFAGGAPVYDTLLPENTSPGITFMDVGGSSEPTFDTSGPQTMRLQIDALSKTSGLEAWNLRKGLIAGLDGFSGTLRNGTYLADVEIIQTLAGYKSDARMFVKTLEVYLHFNRNA